MKIINLNILSIFAGLLLIMSACQKDQYDLGELVTPTNLSVTYEIVGVDADNPNGDGTGVVNFTATADNAITFTFNFGDGSDIKSSPSGKITKQFSITGVNTYQVKVSAVGTGGITSDKTNALEVLSTFEDAEALLFLTGGSSKSWFWAADQPEHVGMGPTSEDYGELDYTWPNWWRAAPWEKSCMYDAEFVFTKTGLGLSFEQIAGPAYIPGTYAGDIGVPGDKCYLSDTVPNLVGVKNVFFSPSSSKASIDGGYRGTTMTFSNNGFMGWWVGTSEYDIIEVTENILKVRIKEDETQAWYHIFTNVRPIEEK